jgi:glycosyltransferase involved in cell wall biosynthesis
MSMPPKQAPVERENPLVSIIVPNFNHARFIGDAIRSVLDQDYRNFEIVVVDDGSTDDSREVVAQFGRRVRYIWQDNQGLSAARNTGIRAAKGALIGLLDADDMYEPAFLSTLVTTLRADPGADGVYCGYRFVDHVNNPLPQIEARHVPDGDLHRALLDANFLVPEAMLVRRHCSESVGPFDENLRACEDWDMWLRITNQYRVIGTTQILTRHRILPGSMSTDPARMLSNRLAVLSNHFGAELEDAEEGDSTKRRAYGRAYLVSCVEYLQYGDRNLAYECLQKMVRVCPGLLNELDTFYQLGCGDQPKGSMGHSASLDVQRNGESLFGMLDKLFDDPDVADSLKGYRHTAYASADFALGLLCYGASDLGAARGHFTRAIITDPRYGINGQFLSTLLKSLLGTRLVSWLKQNRRLG